MKKPVNPLHIVVILVLVVGLLVYFGWKAMSPAEPAAGSYTPGTPPWMDPKSPQYKAGQGGHSGGAPAASGRAPSGGAPSPPPQGNPSIGQSH